MEKVKKKIEDEKKSLTLKKESQRQGVSDGSRERRENLMIEQGKRTEHE